MPSASEPGLSKPGLIQPRSSLAPWPALAGSLLAASAVAGWFAGQSAGLGPRQAAAAAICIAALVLWATAAVPEFAVSMLFFASMMLIEAVPAATLFSGFASPAFWLVLAGMILGMAMVQTGLGARIAQALAHPLAGSYPRMVAGLVAITYGLAFIIPSSMGRIGLMLPVTLALADAVGLVPGRRGRTGLVLAVGFGSYVLATSILTANLPNLIMAGAAEALYGERIGYLPYLLLHAPVLGLAKGVLLVAVVCILFPDRLDRRAGTGRQACTALSAVEWRLAVLLAATVTLWMTSGWHHAVPAWIALAAAVACVMPGIGMLQKDSFAGLNFRVLFYVAGLLGLVAAAGQLGLGVRLGHTLLAQLPLEPDAPVRDFGLLVALSAVLSLGATSDGAPALYTSLAGEISASTGLGLQTVLMIQVIGFSAVSSRIRRHRSWSPCSSAERAWPTRPGSA